MHDLLHHRANATPKKTALIDAETEEEWSYTELDREVDGLAGKLANIGVEEGDHVGVLIDTRTEFVLIFHAVMRLGAVLVPLDVRLTPNELRGQCDKFDISVLVCETETQSKAVSTYEGASEEFIVSVDPTQHRDIK
ncbi:MAG: class I adenylate-forming enzyme family protein, partial [Halobacteria archaeon]|nr:class I adenylate-forming enzyme family protein [Halobacteria archaeon]